MLENRAAVEQKLVEQDTDEQRRLKQTRERVLARLWAIWRFMSKTPKSIKIYRILQNRAEKSFRSCGRASSSTLNQDSGDSIAPPRLKGRFALHAFCSMGA
jgi:hypothetical protein